MACKICLLVEEILARCLEPSDLVFCCLSAVNGWLVSRPTNSLAPQSSLLLLLLLHRLAEQGVARQSSAHSYSRYTCLFVVAVCFSLQLCAYVILTKKKRRIFRISVSIFSLSFPNITNLRFNPLPEWVVNLDSSKSARKKSVNVNKQLTGNSIQSFLNFTVDDFYSRYQTHL